MKLARVSKRINVIRGDIGDLQERIERSMRVLEGNVFPEELDALHKELLEKRDCLVTLKATRMEANVSCGMYEVILKLGEAKSYLRWLDGLDVSAGKSRGRSFDDSRTVMYMSQMTVAEKQVLVDAVKVSIEEMVDQLDDFNAETSIEV